MKKEALEDLKRRYKKPKRSLSEDVFNQNLGELDLRQVLVTRILQYKCRKYSLPDDTLIVGGTYDHAPLLQRISEHQKSEKYLMHKAKLVEKDPEKSS
jgi:hypothetical protein